MRNTDPKLAYKPHKLTNHDFIDSKQGLARYDILDKKTDAIRDHYYELDGRAITKQSAIDYTLYKKCFHVLAEDDREEAYRIYQNG